MQANKMVSRTVLLLWLCTAMGLLIILEQPAGSLMEMHPRMKEWIEKNDIKKVKINMFEFGGATRKPMWLYSPFEWVKDILMFRTRSLAQLKNTKPKKKVSINKAR